MQLVGWVWSKSAASGPVNEGQTGNEHQPGCWFRDLSRTTTPVWTRPDCFLLLAIADSDNLSLGRLLPNATDSGQRRRSDRNPRVASAERIVQAKRRCWSQTRHRRTG